MVTEQILSRGVKDERVLEAMKRIPRHLFVPEGVQSMAYGDYPLSIECEQTISQPYIVALMLEALGAREDAKILEIGTGSGYQTAILSTLVEEVRTIEIRKELAIQAKQKLDDLGCKNIRWKVGDGRIGWKEKAPFDGIVVSAAAMEPPKNLFEQLKSEGGRMVIPVGDTQKVQNLICITRQGDDYKEQRLLSVRFVPLL